MTYGILRACLRLFEATKSLCEVSESLSDTSVWGLQDPPEASVMVSEAFEWLSEASGSLSEAS